MPLSPGSSPAVISKNIAEFHGGKTYSHTAEKFGEKRARAQAIAVALSNARKHPGRAVGGPIGTVAGIAAPQQPTQGVAGGLAPQSGVMMPAPPQNPPAAISSPAVPPAMGPPAANNNPATGSPYNNPAVTAPATATAVPAYASAQPGVGAVPTQQPGGFGVVAPMGAAPVSPMNYPLMGQTQPQPMRRGGSPNRAGGGAPGALSPTGMAVSKPPNLSSNWQERMAAHSLTKGPILSGVPGRTDAHYTHVPSGSYVVPADIVSGRGEGNTIAGANSIQHMFKMGPYGSSAGKIGMGHTMPHPPKMGSMMHSGGGKGGDHVGTPVRVNLAGGEVVIPPENILETIHRLNPRRHFTLKQAHEVLDKWILHERATLRKTLARLPGPVKS